MFQACLMVIPSQVVCFENHAEWRFCALSAQWRSVGAVAPERVVASFLRSRLVSCTCALLWMFILTHATALEPFHSKQSYSLHHVRVCVSVVLMVSTSDLKFPETHGLSLISLDTFEPGLVKVPHRIKRTAATTFMSA